MVRCSCYRLLADSSSVHSCLPQPDRGQVFRKLLDANAFFAFTVCFAIAIAFTVSFAIAFTYNLSFQHEASPLKRFDKRTLPQLDDIIILIFDDRSFNLSCPFPLHSR